MNNTSQHIISSTKFIIENEHEKEIKKSIKRPKVFKDKTLGYGTYSKNTSGGKAYTK